MKKTTILTLIIAFITISNFAQTTANAQTPVVDKEARESTDRLKAKLQLTPEQYQKILSINKYYYTQAGSLKTQGKALTDEAKVKMKVMAQVKDDEINNVLTAEQRSKLAAK